MNALTFPFDINSQTSPVIDSKSEPTTIFPGLGCQLTRSGFEVIWPERTTKVASKVCNGWGLFDCYGNAEEWCFDFCAFDLGVPANASDLVDPVDVKVNIGRLAVGYRGYNLTDQDREQTHDDAFSNQRAARALHPVSGSL